MTAAIPLPHADFEHLTRPELRALADELESTCEPVLVQRCVDFVVAETKGLWHGRARAKLCRRLKCLQSPKPHVRRYAQWALSLPQP